MRRCPSWNWMARSRWPASIPTTSSPAAARTTSRTSAIASPYPTLHLLRETSIARAVAAFPGRGQHLRAQHRDSAQARPCRLEAAVDRRGVTSSIAIRVARSEQRCVEIHQWAWRRPARPAVDRRSPAAAAEVETRRRQLGLVEVVAGIELVQRHARHARPQPGIDEVPDHAKVGNVAAAPTSSGSARAFKASSVLSLPTCVAEFRQRDRELLHLRIARLPRRRIR